MTPRPATDLPAAVALADIGPVTPLGRGGAGVVEAVAPRWLGVGRPLVVKRFHDPETVDRAALEALVRWRRDLPAGERARLDRVAVWPLAVVEDGPRLAGFVMHRVPEGFTATVRLPSGRRAAVACEAQYLLAGGGHTRRLGLAEVARATRREVVCSLAEAIALLHRNRVVVGDLSTRNVLWSPGSGEVLLVDCDSMSLGGVGSPLPPTFTVDWDDPSQPEVAAASADVYKLGLFALRCLARSFRTRDPAALDGRLDHTGRWLVQRSLAPQPRDRPGAAAWERWAAGSRAAATTRTSSHIGAER